MTPAKLKGTMSVQVEGEDRTLGTKESIHSKKLHKRLHELAESHSFSFRLFEKNSLNPA
jgi:hypothetical protein